MACSAPVSAQPLPLPDGEVVLVIEGDIARTNINGQAHFDLTMLQALPTRALITEAPGHDGLHHFEGTPLALLLEHVGAASHTFRAEALDDYSVVFDGVDLARYPVIVAYQQDGVPISRRALGPLRIVLPYTDHPELRTRTGDAMSIWQLVNIRVL